MSKKWFAVVLLIVAVSAGCRRSPAEVSMTPTEDSREPTADTSTEVPLAVADTSQPDEVVSAFLDALRDGDDKIAEALLTTIARRETKKHELAVQPPGSPSARYEIGDIKPVQGGVHVNSIWSEYDSAGEQLVYEIVWVLRRESIGWRVAGMATAVNPAKPPIFLNFEDVPDLLQKWKQADDELAAQMEQAESLQAAQPASTLKR